MMTSFTRIIIVLSIVRQAMGLQQTPPNQVLIGLALFLSFFVMAPTINQINTTAIQPYAESKIGATEMIKVAAVPLHAFMAKQTRKKDITMFAGIAKSGPYQSANDIPFSVLLPAFVTSELKTAFQIGFLVFLPFIRHRPRGRDGADVARHDDDVADDHFDAVQAAAVRAGRRLGADHGQPCKFVRELTQWTPIIS